MALSAVTLAALMKSKIEAVSDFPSAGTHPIFSDDRILLAVAQAVVEHIVANAQVIVTSVTGVQSGAGTSGPGTGTIT